MLKKMLSALTVMLFVFGMNAGAQNLEIAKRSLCKMQPKSASADVKTTIIDTKANEFWTGYWNGLIDENTMMIGVKQIPMDYDNAICYPAGTKSIEGMTIEGIKFVIADATNIKNVKVWMSSYLPDTPDEADICCQEVTEVTDASTQDYPYNEVRFNTPFKYNIEEDLYIGYSFEVTGGNGDYEKYPVVIQAGDEYIGGLFMKSGGAAGEWGDYYGKGFGVIAIQALMSGDFAENEVKMNSVLGDIVGTKNDFDLPISIDNVGTNGISSLDLTVSVGGVETKFEAKPEAPVMGYGNNFSFIEKINTPAESGKYNISISVDKINGVDNPKKTVANGTFIVVSRVAEHKMFMEEFTAMWCGWCPRGMIAMEKLSKKYGEQFVPVAVHVSDALDCFDYVNVIQSTVEGYPNAHVDRTTFGIDPYYGSSKTEFGIEKDLLKSVSVIPMAEVFAKAKLEDNIVKATAEIKFLYTGSAANYAVGYIITENGMSDKFWKQANFFYQFAGQGLEEIEPMFEPWVNGQPEVAGVVYNDVAIAAQGIEWGIENSIPTKVEEEKIVTHSVDFDLSGYETIKDVNNLNVIVLLFNTMNGMVMNSDIFPLSSDTGIDGVENTNDNVETSRYTVDGRRIFAPQKGINIVKYSDGTVKKFVVE